jgi:hypothetical protein
LSISPESAHHAKCPTFDAILNTITPLMNIMFIPEVRRAAVGANGACERFPIDAGDGRASISVFEFFEFEAVAAAYFDFGVGCWNREA